MTKTVAGQGLQNIALTELPPPASGRTGWPWTEASAALPASMPNDVPWPRVTVVTPSFQQAQFLEETIRSVLLQGYPNLEYIVIDGGSTDGSVEIIEKYAAWLTYWVSEPDRGQSHAVNKGWAQATGNIWAWLNSDDTYLPGSIAKSVVALQQHQPAKFAYGTVLFTDAVGRTIGSLRGQPLQPGLRKMYYWEGWNVPQPTLFFYRELVEKYGPLDESYHYALDYEWLIRLSHYVNHTCLKDTLATYRLHGDSKTGGDWEQNKHLFFAECRRVNRKHAPWWRPRNWPLWTAQLRYDLKPKVKRSAA